MVVDGVDGLNQLTIDSSLPICTNPLSLNALAFSAIRFSRFKTRCLSSLVNPPDSTSDKVLKDSLIIGMIAIALAERRVMLTRDTQLMKRRVITNGQLKVILVKSDKPELQMQQVIDTLNLDCSFRPFTICLECNHPLIERSKQQVEDLVPPYVFQTQNQYMECPACHRIYWRGTHWQAMTKNLEKFIRG